MEAFACPHCSRLFYAAPAILGKRIRCRGCRNIFGVPRTETADPQPTEKHPSALPRVKPAALLPVAVEAVINGIDVRNCPSCGHSFAMKAEWAGSTIRCRACQQVYRLAASTVASGPLAFTPAYHGSQQVKEASSAAVQKPPAVPAPAEQRHDNDHRWDASPAPSKNDAESDAGDVVADTEGGFKVPFAVKSSPGFVYAQPASAIAPVIAIILGGLTALPITQLILWWGLERDPLKMVARLPASLQWVVPDSLRKP